MDKKTVLLLVPPSNKQHIRDFYCSFSSKAGYYWPAQDLVILSGNLSKIFEVKVIDAVALKMSFKDCLKEVSSSNADMIIAATGSATLKDDFYFLKLVKESNPLIKIVISSSIFMSIGVKILKDFTFLDGVLLDFTNNDAVNFLSGKYDDIKNMFFRNGKIIEKCSEPEKTFGISIPRHDLFLNKGYKIQLFGGKYFITTITSIGCPYKCSFCCAGIVKYRTREIDNVIQEIKYVARELKINNIFFANPILFTNKESALKLLNSIIKNELFGIKWIANVRIDLLDEELICLMKLAGCKALLFGIESGDQDILDKYSKGIALSDSKAVFKLCEKYKIITLAYFMLGFPEECLESINKTLEYIRGASCDYISVGFAVPDIGTIFRSTVIQENYCTDDFMKSWDSSLKPYIKNSSFSENELIKIRRKIYRSFYLRPSWIKRHLLGTSLVDLIKGGMKILNS
jgi:hypothetical protein